MSDENGITCFRRIVPSHFPHSVGLVTDTILPAGGAGPNKEIGPPGGVAHVPYAAMILLYTPSQRNGRVKLPDALVVPDIGGWGVPLNE